MNSKRPHAAFEIAVTANALDAQDRAAFLDEACDADPLLRSQVDVLMGTLATPPSDVTRDEDSPEPHSAPIEPATGQRRLGGYQIVGPLGIGGMGEVYRAYDSRLARDVAIKVLRRDVAADPRSALRFQREARAAAALNHPNILDIHQIGSEGDTVYLVHELLKGSTLRNRIDSRSISLAEALNFAIQIASGVAAAHHKGIVHRDLKPENVFITLDGRVKILDFGLAKTTHPAGSSEPETQPGSVIGTNGYMSPEQLRGEIVDHRADLFSFGAILFEMISGQRAFTGTRPVDVMLSTLTHQPPDIKADFLLNELIQQCLNKHRDDRIQSAVDVLFLLNLVGRRSENPRRDIAGITRVAILPIVAGVGDAALHWCESVTQALVLAAVTLRDVQVISIASIRECQRRRLSLRALADALSADLLVEAHMVGSSDSEILFTILDARGTALTRTPL